MKRLPLILALLTLLIAMPASAIPILPEAPPGATLTTPALLDSLQRTAFQFFWYESSPISGLIKDRSTAQSASSIASQGFGFTAITIAIDHGWITRDEGRARIRLALDTLWNLPQGTAVAGTGGYKGFFYHFIDMTTGLRTWNSELSTIDTALLMAGILDARAYFDTDDVLDVELRQVCTDLYERVDWEWARDGTYGIKMGWRPESGFSTFGTWVGYNEAMILYLLALGSPTHPIPEIDWTYWTAGYQWQTHYGFSFVICPPLFTHQYSHCWVDFRNLQDPWMSQRGIDYFENSRRATLANRAYCIANPNGHSGYSDLYWGLTASDDPWGYAAHGAPPAWSDNGTITPTAAAGSIAFAPDEVVPSLHAFYDDLGIAIWGEYGFKDAFNMNEFWWATDYIGIDQGPIVIMIENYLHETVWRRYNNIPEIALGLERAQFETVTAVEPLVASGIETWVSPNPFTQSTTVSFRVGRTGPVTLELYDTRGRRVWSHEDQGMDKGVNRITVPGADLPSGVYFYKLASGSDTVWKRCVLVK